MSKQVGIESRIQNRSLRKGRRKFRCSLARYFGTFVSISSTHTKHTQTHTQNKTHRLVITVLWYLILETIDFSFLILKDDGYARSIPYGTIRKPRKGNRKISKRTKWDLRYLEQSLRLECLHWIGVQDWNFLKHLNVSVYS